MKISLPNFLRLRGFAVLYGDLVYMKNRLAFRSIGTASAKAVQASDHLEGKEKELDYYDRFARDVDMYERSRRRGRI